MAEICKSRASKTGFTDNWKHHKPNRWMKQILIVCHEKTVPKKEMMMLKMAGKKRRNWVYPLKLWKHPKSACLFRVYDEKQKLEQKNRDRTYRIMSQVSVTIITVIPANSTTLLLDNKIQTKGWKKRKRKRKVLPGHGWMFVCLCLARIVERSVQIQKP